MSSKINTKNESNSDRFIKFIVSHSHGIIEKKDWRNIIWAIQEKNDSLSSCFTNGDTGEFDLVAANPRN